MQCTKILQSKTTKSRVYDAEESETNDLRGLIMVIVIMAPISGKWKPVGNVHRQCLPPLQRVIRSIRSFEHNLDAQYAVLINNYWAKETADEGQDEPLSRNRGGGDF